MTRLRVLLALVVVAIVAGGVFAAGYWVRGQSEPLPATNSPSPPLAEHHPGLPNPELTPGAVNPAVTPETIDRTICKVGWTATVRPPSSYTSALKLAQILQYGYADRNPSHYQEDHLVPLELGGAPRDPRNLWPQPNVATLPDGTSIGADAKDGLEDELKRRVCARTLELSDAQRMIAGDWVQAWEAAGRP
jgi:hypothetical protein